MSKELIERLRSEWRKPENKPPEMCEAANEIEQLRAQLKEAQEAAEFNFQQYQDAGRLLCEAQAEIEQWKANSRENKLIAEQMAEPYKREIASSQAREQKLLDVQFTIYKPAAPHGAQFKGAIVDGEPPWIYDQSPSSGFVASMKVVPVSALEAMIAKAGEVMMERCACIRYDEKLEKSIRALPGVTLEDLK